MSISAASHVVRWWEGGGRGWNMELNGTFIWAHSALLAGCLNEQMKDRSLLFHSGPFFIILPLVSCPVLCPSLSSGDHNAVMFWVVLDENDDSSYHIHRCSPDEITKIQTALSADWVSHKPINAIIKHIYWFILSNFAAWTFDPDKTAI